MLWIDTETNAGLETYRRRAWKGARLFLAARAERGAGRRPIPLRILKGVLRLVSRRVSRLCDFSTRVRKEPAVETRARVQQVVTLRSPTLGFGIFDRSSSRVGKRTTAPEFREGRRRATCWAPRRRSSSRGARVGRRYISTRRTRGGNKRSSRRKHGQKGGNSSEGKRGQLHTSTWF